MSPAVGVDGFVVEVRMELDLVDRGHDITFGRQAFQMVDLEVRDSDRAGPAVAVELLHRLPRRHEIAVIERWERPVDQEEVDVVEAELGERLVDRTAGVVGPVKAVGQLARYKDVVAVEPGGADR